MNSLIPRTTVDIRSSSTSDLFENDPNNALLRLQTCVDPHTAVPPTGSCNSQRLHTDVHHLHPIITF